MTTPHRWVSWGERNPQSRGTSSLFCDMPDGGWGPVLVLDALPPVGATLPRMKVPFRGLHDLHPPFFAVWTASGELPDETPGVVADIRSIVRSGDHATLHVNVGGPVVLGGMEVLDDLPWAEFRSTPFPDDIDDALQEELWWALLDKLGSPHATDEWGMRESGLAPWLRHTAECLQKLRATDAPTPGTAARASHLLELLARRRPARGRWRPPNENAPESRRYKAPILTSPKRPTPSLYLDELSEDATEATLDAASDVARDAWATLHRHRELYASGGTPDAAFVSSVAEATRADGTLTLTLTPHGPTAVVSSEERQGVEWWTVMPRRKAVAWSPR